MLLLRCPNCGNKMKYQGLDNKISGKRKNCVYCGKSFDIKKNIIKKLIN